MNWLEHRIWFDIKTIHCIIIKEKGQRTVLQVYGIRNLPSDLFTCTLRWRTWGPQEYWTKELHIWLFQASCLGSSCSEPTLSCCVLQQSNPSLEGCPYLSSTPDIMLPPVHVCGSYIAYISSADTMSFYCESVTRTGPTLAVPAPILMMYFHSLCTCVYYLYMCVHVCLAWRRQVCVEWG